MSEFFVDTEGHPHEREDETNPSGQENPLSPSPPNGVHTHPHAGRVVNRPEVREPVIGEQNSTSMSSAGQTIPHPPQSFPSPSPPMSLGNVSIWHADQMLEFETMLLLLQQSLASVDDAMTQPPFSETSTNAMQPLQQQQAQEPSLMDDILSLFGNMEEALPSTPDPFHTVAEGQDLALDNSDSASFPTLLQLIEQSIGATITVSDNNNNNNGGGGNGGSDPLDISADGNDEEEEEDSDMSFDLLK